MNFLRALLTTRIEYDTIDKLLFGVYGWSLKVWLNFQISALDEHVGLLQEALPHETYLYRNFKHGSRLLDTRH